MKLNDILTAPEAKQPKHGGKRQNSGRKKTLPEGATTRSIKATEDEYIKLKEYLEQLRKPPE
jgi:hypothetical protein